MDDPPQEPEFVADGVPMAQPNCAALLQVPLIGHGSSTILQVSLVCHDRVQFQVDACPQVRLSGSGDTWFVGAPRVQVLILELLHKGSNGCTIIMVPEEESSQLAHDPIHDHERESKVHEKELVQTIRFVHVHERESGEAIKFPNEVASSILVELAISWVSIIDEIKGIFPCMVIPEGYSLRKEELSLMVNLALSFGGLLDDWFLFEVFLTVSFLVVSFLLSAPEEGITLVTHQDWEEVVSQSWKGVVFDGIQNWLSITEIAESIYFSHVMSIVFQKLRIMSYILYAKRSVFVLYEAISPLK